jgi:hypothetical protein
MLKKTLFYGAAAAAVALGTVGYVVAQTEVVATRPDLVLVDLSLIAHDMDRRLDLQGQGTGIAWVPAPVAAQACNVSVADLAPPMPGHAAVCMAQRSSVALDDAVRREVSNLVE